MTPNNWSWRTFDERTGKYLNGTFPTMDACRKQARAVAKRTGLTEYKERFTLHLIDDQGQVQTTHGWDAEEPDFSGLLA